MTSGDQKRAGFVALVGMPNAGKSTLLNALVARPLSITSPKPGTTRFPLRGVGCVDNTQIVVVDTPGLLQRPKTTLDRAMVRSALDALAEVDHILVVVDVSRPDPWKKLQNVLAEMPASQLWVVFNKIDQIHKPKLLKWAAKYQDRVSRIFMVSALHKEGTADVWQALATQMPEGPWLFDAQTCATLPQRLWSAEITREILLHTLQEEIPHQLYVETERFETGAKGALIIGQVIHVQTRGHKKIVLGKGGDKIKEVGQRARLAIAARFKKTVHLYLHTRVTEDWMDKPAFYRMVGLPVQ